MSASTAPRGRDWRTVLLAVAAVTGILFAALLAALILVYAALLPAGFSVAGPAPSTLDILISASAFLFMGATALPAAYYSITYLAGAPSRPVSPSPLRIWHGAVLFVLWIASAVFAGLLSDKVPWQWLTPPLYLAAIAIPVYFLVRLTSARIDTGSWRRFWGLLTTGMTAGPALAISAELAVAIVLGVAAVVYLALSPGQLPNLEALARRLSAAHSGEETLNILQPLLANPLSLVFGLAFFSGFAPLIEETSKSVAVWLVFDHLDSQAQGFVAGALSGAGFGLLESLLASATPGPSWAPTLLIRGGSSMMHIAAASLTGWGIARFRQTRQVGPLVGGYASAMLIHGLWNAAVVSITYGALRLATDGVSPALGPALLTGMGATVLGVLCLSLPIGLGVMNARFRPPRQSPETGPSAPSGPALPAPS